MEVIVGDPTVVTVRSPPLLCVLPAMSWTPGAM
jgi:hypothetical protein